MILEAMPAGQPWLFGLMLWRTALRQAEALNLEWRDLQFASAQPSVTVRNGKGGRFRVVPAHPELVEAFRSVPHRSPADKVFTGRSGKPLSPRSAARWVAEGIAKAGLQAAATGTGVKGPASHSLRPPLAAVRPERQRRLCLAGPQQSDCNPQHLPGTGAGHPGGHQRCYVTIVGRINVGINGAAMVCRRHALFT